MARSGRGFFCLHGISSCDPAQGQDHTSTCDLPDLPVSTETASPDSVPRVQHSHTHMLGGRSQGRRFKRSHVRLSHSPYCSAVCFQGQSPFSRMTPLREEQMPELLVQRRPASASTLRSAVALPVDHTAATIRGYGVGMSRLHRKKRGLDALPRCTLCMMRNSRWHIAYLIL